MNRSGSFRRRLLADLLGGSAALWVVAAPLDASAHHSFAAFDMEHEVKLTGVVERYQWANPHVEIALVVPDEGGRPKEWRIDAASIGILSRAGWKSTTLQPGQKVTLSVHPVKSGDPHGALARASLPDGRVLNGEAAPPPVAVQ